MKTKELIRDIQRQGGILLRNKGSHWIFKIGEQTISVPFSGRHTEVTPGILHKVNKALGGICHDVQA